LKLQDILKQDAVTSDLKAKNRDQVLKEMVDALVPEIGPKKEELFKMLRVREDQCPTAIKDGVAIPHGRVPGMDRIFMGFARSRQGIPFGAPDSKPTHLFFLIFAPQNSAGEHLKVLARIARLCREPDIRRRLMQASSSQEIYRILTEEDKKL
jgi:PTS system nitrogen regulatory IIA component